MEKKNRTIIFNKVAKTMGAYKYKQEDELVASYCKTNSCKTNNSNYHT
jgi:hypothetical protein